MKIRNDLTEEELKLYLMCISATLAKNGKSSMIMEVPSPVVNNDKYGVITFKQEVRTR